MKFGVKKIKLLDETILYSNMSSLFSNDVNDPYLYADIDFSNYVNDFEINNLNLCINISNTCNLNCSYCFNKEKKYEHIDVEMIKNKIDYFIENFPKCDKYFVDLSGKGEPLLNLPLIYDINDYCKKLSDKISREILVSFVCNGTLLTPKVAEKLQNKGILFGVSLDGDKINHNLYRKDINGNDTYDVIINNVAKIKYRDYIGCAVTLSDNVFSLVDSLKELSKYFKTISYKPVRDNKIGINKKCINGWLYEYRKLTLFLCETLEQNDLKFIKIILNGEDYFGKFIFRCLTNQRTLNRCDAGISRFTINSNGKIYDCPAQSLSNNKESIIDAKTNLAKQVNRLWSECSSCDYKYICGGECNVMFKEKEKNDKIMCKFKKGLIELAIFIAFKIKYVYNSRINDELMKLCNEKNMRNCIDEELKEFLYKHKEYSFSEGKKIFDEINKRY